MPTSGIISSQLGRTFAVQTFAVPQRHEIRNEFWQLGHLVLPRGRLSVLGWRSCDVKLKIGTEANSFARCTSSGRWSRREAL